MSGSRRELQNSSVIRLRIQIRDIQPSIFRVVDVVETTTLSMLHHVIQSAFAWENYHLFEFEAGGIRYGEPYEDEDLWDSESESTDSVMVGGLYALGIRRFTYVYDFGDYWVHDIRLRKPAVALTNVNYPVLIEGQRRRPPEDVGGVSGYDRFLDAITDTKHEEHQAMLEWGGPYDPEEMDTLLNTLEDQEK